MASVDYEALFDAVPGALAVFSPEMVFVAANRGYERAVGRDRADLVGRDVFEVFPGGSSGGGEALRASLERVLAEGEPDIMMLQRYDVEIPGKPGIFEDRYWNIANAPLRDDEGRIAGIVNHPQDVTPFIRRLEQEGPSASIDAAMSPMAAVQARLFAQTSQLHEINVRLRRSHARERREAESLRRAVREQRQAVADTSHDLRGPLAGLQLRLQDALADPGADPREILLATLEDAERLGDIIGDLLELARLEAGVPADAEPVDLAGLVRTELARLVPRITTASRLDPGAVVEGSPIRLARLVANLLANAQRHGRTRLQAAVGIVGGHAVLEIGDDGPGIPDADKEQIFARFYRRADARLADPGGTGLGLAISRQIAQVHGGTLHAADHPDGSPGALFVLRLPLLHG